MREAPRGRRPPVYGGPQPQPPSPALSPVLTSAAPDFSEADSWLHSVTSDDSSFSSAARHWPSAGSPPAMAEPSAPVPAAVEQAAHNTITRNALEAPIRFLSSDALEGRGPGTRGDQLARLYLATQLESLGLKPGGPNGQWQQPVDMVGIKAQFPKTWSLQGKSERVDPRLARRLHRLQRPTKRERLCRRRGAGVRRLRHRGARVQVERLKGVNLKGKVLEMLNNDPDWDPQLFRRGKRRLYYGRWGL